MTLDEFKKRACEVEEAIIAKGYSPKKMWRLLRVLQGDLTPPESTVSYELWWHRKPRKYLTVKPIAPPPKYKPIGSDHCGTCLECGAPLSFSGVCRECGADNYWNVRLGITRKDKK